MSSWCDSSTRTVPMALTSRPDENDFPSPRHTTARTSGRRRSSSSTANSCASMSSSNALCFSGLSLVMVATGPSTSSRTLPAISSGPGSDEHELVDGGGVAEVDGATRSALHREHPTGVVDEELLPRHRVAAAVEDEPADVAVVGVAHEERAVLLGPQPAVGAERRPCRGGGRVVEHLRAHARGGAVLVGGLPDARLARLAVRAPAVVAPDRQEVHLVVAGRTVVREPEVLVGGVEVEAERVAHPVGPERVAGDGVAGGRAAVRGDPVDLPR